ncbi:glutathione S-transferase family protein [Jannaschia sp. LMIT008]|uniref:glutathione S-transferase family protein n=1 Tax=Jannaschia maritima TaxID=3032585 RepID=UPI0028114660|nr:glutathione S-transferase family protein [Jannaschia sp. LMIT008]
MGKLIDGVWQDRNDVGQGKDGAFVRADSSFRDWIDGDGDHPPEAGRYHLYVGLACPWAHRALIVRALKGLEDAIDVSVVHPDMLKDGWTFDTDFSGATGDRLMGLPFLRDVYVRADPHATTRATVPILWDRMRDTIVSNESAEIIRMFGTAFDDLTGNRLDLYPPDMRAEIDRVNDRVYHAVNNGVYKSGFATSQSAYDDAVTALFDALDWLEGRLGERRYVAGDCITEADWRLFTTLVRFDLVYHGHFKCNRRKLIEYPRLWAYARELYGVPGVAGTCDFGHISRHYHYSHESINPYRIVPIGPEPDWTEPHGRGDSVFAYRG